MTRYLVGTRSGIVHVEDDGKVARLVRQKATHRGEVPAMLAGAMLLMAAAWLVAIAAVLIRPR